VGVVITGVDFGTGCDAGNLGVDGIVLGGVGMVGVFAGDTTAFCCPLFAAPGRCDDPCEMAFEPWPFSSLDLMLHPSRSTPVAYCKTITAIAIPAMPPTTILAISKAAFFAGGGLL
jgi:hypothetical protein